MLWYKAWLELRFRVLLTVTIIGSNCVFAWFDAEKVLMTQDKAKLMSLIPVTPLINEDLLHTAFWVRFMLIQALIIVPIVAMILAGSGINTQTSYGMTHGLHSSMLYTLSLPVSRYRMVLTRASLGFICFAGFLILNMAVPHIVGRYLGIPLDWTEGLKYIPGLFAGGFFYYCLFVLTASFLDEFWGSTLGFFFIGGFVGYSNGGKGYETFDLIHLIRGTHYLATGEWPYVAWLVYAVLGLMLIWGSVLIVERKEV